MPPKEQRCDKLDSALSRLCEAAIADERVNTPFMVHDQPARGLVTNERVNMQPCPHCGADTCNYEDEAEPCYGSIALETRDAYADNDGSVDEFETHSCDGHRGSGWQHTYVTEKPIHRISLDAPVRLRSPTAQPPTPAAAVSPFPPAHPFRP